MNGYGRREGDRLRRIALMLIALAALADLACGRSRKIRRNVLDILRPAEFYAWDFMLETAQDRGMYVVETDLPEDGDSVEDALRIAHSFRMLALALFALATLTVVGRARCDACVRFETTLRHLFDKAAIGISGRALPRPYIDTS